MNKKDIQARYWNKKDDKNIICSLCPKECVITLDSKGFCMVRQNVDNELVSNVYGQTSGFCIDPIEKKPLYHFYPGTSVLSFGTAGCNLGCRFCQNSNISRAKDTAFLTEKAEPKDIALLAKKLDCKSVAFTYNDPIVFIEYAIDTAIECQNIGIKTVAVTSGYMKDAPRKDFYKHIDAANVDLKSFNNNFYKEYSLGELKPVLDTLIHIKQNTKAWLEITTLIIEGLNDDEKEIESMCSWITDNLGIDVPLHFSAFYPAYKMLDHKPTTFRALKKARDIAIQKGLRYVYTGNVVDPDGSTTYCHGCTQKLIERENYEIALYNITNGACPKCLTKCAGHFDNEPGNWGAKRQPVDINILK